MEDADERARLLPQTPDALASLAGAGVPPAPQDDDSLKRYIQEVREISRETGSAKVVEWISVPCAVLSTVAPFLVPTILRQPGLRRGRFFRVLLALIGVETFAGFGIPPMIVLWNLYANENETVVSPAVVARERKALRGVIGCQVIVTVCLVVAAAARPHERQEEAGGAAAIFPPLQHKEAFFVAACELASAFVFVVLGVYKWLIAQAITSLSLRADAITCFATVYLNLVAGVAHLCDAFMLTRTGAFTPTSKERVRYFEYFSLAAAVFLLGAAVCHLRAAVHIPRPI